MMVEMGDKVRFDPFKETTGFASEDHKGKMVTGTVMLLSPENGWFAVEYKSGGYKLWTSFKFSQIGKDVFICGH